MVMYTDFIEYTLESGPGTLMGEKSEVDRIIDSAEGYIWSWRHQSLWIPLATLIVEGVP